MCSLTDNIYKIEFNEFNIRDMDSGVQLFHVAKDPNMPDIDPAMIPPELEDQVRCIQYDFGADFLQLRTIGTQLTFSIGPHEVPNFRMIERHYFRNYMIRSFDFTFGCAQQPYRCRAALRGPPPEALTPSALHSRQQRLPPAAVSRVSCHRLTQRRPGSPSRQSHTHPAPLASQPAASASPTRPTHGRPSTSCPTSSRS